MLSLKTKETIELKSAPGVTVTARVLSKAAVMRRDLGTVDARRRLSLAQLKSQAMLPVKSATTDEEKAARAKEWAEKIAAFSPDERMTYFLLDEDIAAITKLELRPAAIRAGIVSITGIEIDGAAATIDQVTEHASEEVLDELHAICEDRAGLPEDIAKNLPSLSTSAGQVDGESLNSTVATASA
jgi:hypothetical protein